MCIRDSLSVTQIDQLIRNPYAVYARSILKLRVLEQIDAPITAAHSGSVVHALFDRLVCDHPETLPDDVAAAIRGYAENPEHFMHGQKEVVDYWRARLAAAADWLAEFEAARDDVVARHSELTGAMTWEIAGSPFTLTARADRIDRHRGGRFTIIDYKTGTLPSRKRVEDGYFLQLPLEAAILAAGGFEGLPEGRIAELLYVRLTGGTPAGEQRAVSDPPARAREAKETVARLIARYRDPATPYRAHLRPHLIAYDDPYDHLARRAEWSNVADTGDAS